MQCVSVVTLIEVIVPSNNCHTVVSGGGIFGIASVSAFFRITLLFLCGSVVTHHSIGLVKYTVSSHDVSFMSSYSNMSILIVFRWVMSYFFRPLNKEEQNSLLLLYCRMQKKWTCHADNIHFTYMYSWFDVSNFLLLNWRHYFLAINTMP